MKSQGLRPIRSSRRLNRKAAWRSFQTRQQWKPWKGWRAQKTLWEKLKEFEPSKHKRVLLGLALLTVIVFASNIAIGVFGPHSNGNNGGDPTNTIARLDDTHLTGWNSINTATGTNELDLTPNSTNVAVAISKSPIDISSANSRELVLDTSMHFFSGCCGQTIGFYDWFLTTTSNLPSDSTTYNPRNDAHVMAIYQMSNCSGGSCDFEFMEKTNRTGTDTIGQEDFGACGTSSSCSTFTRTTVSTLNGMALFLNYSGANAGAGSVRNGASCGAIGDIFAGSLQCNVQLDTPAGVTVNMVGTASSRMSRYPILDLGTKYFVGFYVSKSPGAVGVGFTGQEFVSDAITISNFVPVAGAGGAPGPIQASGFFAPLINWLIQAGVFMLKEVFGFFGWLAGVLGPVLSNVFQILENFIVFVLNAVGNLLGWGNLGTDLQTLISNLITFLTDPTNGLPFWITQVPAYMSRFFNWIALGATWVGPSLTLAQNAISVALAGFTQAITILSVGLQFFAASSAFLVIFSFFIYVGDDAITGVIDWAGTIEKLMFSLINIIFDVINVSLDFIVLIISLVPKPFVQSSAGKIPRLPSLGVGGGSIAWPRFDFAEALSGNLVTYFFWIIGFYMSAWYESRNPALVGSVGALVPAAASNMQLLATLLPVIQVFVFFSGGLCLFWIVNRPLMVIGLPDVLEDAGLGVGPGRAGRGGPSLVTIKGGVKHFGPAVLGTQERIKRADQKRHPALLGAREGVSVEEQATA